MIFLNESQGLMLISLSVSVITNAKATEYFSPLLDRYFWILGLRCKSLFIQPCSVLLPQFWANVLFLSAEILQRGELSFVEPAYLPILGKLENSIHTTYS